MLWLCSPTARSHQIVCQRYGMSRSDQSSEDLCRSPTIPTTLRALPIAAAVDFGYLLLSGIADGASH